MRAMWKITRDVTEDRDIEVESVNFISDFDFVALRQKFRILNGDDEVDYLGYALGWTGSEDGFDPLDDFAEGTAGSTAIEYWEAGLPHSRLTKLPDTAGKWVRL